MGYCYSASTGKLACDCCGIANGVRRRPCTYKVHNADGGSLPMCKAPAYCKACYEAKGKSAGVHAPCEAYAAMAQAREDQIKARLANGESQVRCAYGSWHYTVPAGKVGVMFQNKFCKEWFLVDEADYKGGGWLSDFPNSEPWENHPVDRLSS